VKQQIIFAVDVRIAFDTYRKVLCGKVTSRTIFTVNPCTKAGFTLYNYAKTAVLSPTISYIDNIKNNALKNLTIGEFRSLMNAEKMNKEHIIINGVITDLNIDHDVSSKFILKCKSCYLKCDSFSKRCTNDECSDFNNKNGFYDFETTINISDHTCTLKNIKINSKIFLKMFNYKIDKANFQIDKMTEIKWKLLLERWLMLIKVSDFNYALLFFFKIINYCLKKRFQNPKPTQSTISS
jgi:hypothetical protein